jgi:hypothetical protein
MELFSGPETGACAVVALDLLDLLEDRIARS